MTSYGSAIKCAFHCIILLCITIGLCFSQENGDANSNTLNDIIDGTAPLKSSPLLDNSIDNPHNLDSNGLLNVQKSAIDLDKVGQDTKNSLAADENQDSENSDVTWDKLKFREWGKRDLSSASPSSVEQEDRIPADKKWDQQSRLWGKRAWGASGRNWGKRADDDVENALLGRPDDAELLEADKKWESNSRLWGKRADIGNVNDQYLHVALGADEAADKRSWSQNSRMWGKRSDDDVTMDKKWDQQSRLWGKRSDLESTDDSLDMDKKWQEQSRMWGKRADDPYMFTSDSTDSLDLDKKWDQQSRLWGKRADDMDFDNDLSADKKWDQQNSRLWGKRDEAANSWNTGNSRLWGKREGDIEEEKRWGNTPQRVWGKRQWGGKMRRVWGKRDDEMVDSAEMDMASSNDDQKRAWGENTNARVWGKRAWGASGRNWGKRDSYDDTSSEDKRAWGDANTREWGKRSKRSVDSVDDLVQNLNKRLWYSDYKRRWGKRSNYDDILNDVLDNRAWDDDVSNDVMDKRAWGDNSRAWGKRGWGSMDEDRVQWGKRYEPRGNYVIPDMNRRTWGYKNNRVWG